MSSLKVITALLIMLFSLSNCTSKPIDIVPEKKQNPVVSTSPIEKKEEPQTVVKTEKPKQETKTEQPKIKAENKKTEKQVIKQPPIKVNKNTFDIEMLQRYLGQLKSFKTKLDNGVYKKRAEEDAPTFGVSKVSLEIEYTDKACGDTNINIPPDIKEKYSVCTYSSDKNANLGFFTWKDDPDKYLEFVRNWINHEVGYVERELKKLG